MSFQDRTSYRGPVKAVILDWAGTTVDYGSFAPTAVFLRLFEEHNIKITAEDARAGMGLMKKDHLRVILQRPTVAQAWNSTHGSAPSEEDIERLFQDFMPMQLSVLKEYAKPIPGLLQVVEELHSEGIKIGSTTGYLRLMMDVLATEAKQYGYEPDCMVSPDEVPAGRPYPWMCYRNAMQLNVFPMHAMIKVGDTLPDMEEGLNAGMWTVGVSLTGSLLGLTEEEVHALSADEKTSALQRVERKLYEAGAHYVIEGIWDLPKIVDDVNAWLAKGKRP